MTDRECSTIHELRLFTFNMALRTQREISRPAKRFKACKVRIRSVSTSGERTSKSVRLKVNSNSKNSEYIDECWRKNAGETCTSQALATEIVRPNLQAFTEHEQMDSESEASVPQHQKRKVKSYENWEKIREALLRGRIEEESFAIGEERCVSCNEVAEVRCIDCGHEQKYCIECAKKNHDQRNYFHVLERFKVSIHVHLSILLDDFYLYIYI